MAYSQFQFAFTRSHFEVVQRFGAIDIRTRGGAGCLEVSPQGTNKSHPSQHEIIIGLVHILIKWLAANVTFSLVLTNCDFRTLNARRFWRVLIAVEHEVHGSRYVLSFTLSIE